jgi:hypothetical protein
LSGSNAQHIVDTNASKEKSSRIYRRTEYQWYKLTLKYYKLKAGLISARGILREINKTAIFKLYIRDHFRGAADMNYPNIANLFRSSDTDALKNPSSTNETSNDPSDPSVKEVFKLDSFLVNSKYALNLDELI